MFQTGQTAILFLLLLIKTMVINYLARICDVKMFLAKT